MFGRSVLWNCKKNINCIAGGTNSVSASNAEDAVNFDNIFEWDPITWNWKEIGTLKKGRYGHAMSVINFGDVSKFCK